MSRLRTTNSYSSLQEIISALKCNDFPDMTWVGKDYTKGQLIADLEEVYANSVLFMTKEEHNDIINESFNFCPHWDCGWCYKDNTKYTAGCVGSDNCDYMLAGGCSGN